MKAAMKVFYRKLLDDTRQRKGLNDRDEKRKQQPEKVLNGVPTSSVAPLTGGEDYSVSHHSMFFSQQYHRYQMHAGPD